MFLMKSNAATALWLGNSANTRDIKRKIRNKTYAHRWELHNVQGLIPHMEKYLTSFNKFIKCNSGGQEEEPAADMLDHRRWG